MDRGKEWSESRYGGEIGLVAGVCGDQQLRVTDSARKTRGNSPADGNGAKLSRSSDGHGTAPGICKTLVGEASRIRQFGERRSGQLQPRDKVLAYGRKTFEMDDQIDTFALEKAWQSGSRRN